LISELHSLLCSLASHVSSMLRLVAVASDFASATFCIVC